MDNEHSETETRSREAFWKSRKGIVLIGILIGIGLPLVYQHRVHVFSGTGALVAFLVLCFGMHLFMHGGHGGHGGSPRDHD